ncbi:MULTISPECIES: outer membrane protein transport protein [Acinetobacter]|uniref:Long-chain fatty acid transporter n=1 Tax=Acinetobacter genomosp. 15BJ TaxID=106651 RepID=R9BBS2_9GAMM|nr:MULTISPECIES: outer membrane protein transport protein [Acinetobacter]EOR09811.1 long-chain fatty acid transporter [Acinetobacter genomosp. 15BJ]MCH7292076.1 outer membrane protein transport protein [Acinetobacter genomosp. 15BJ]MCI3879913.1 outer membrane protein transport protein [Acinetobacter higginsii]MDO3656887.1 outer membrane protein transport protein [Acinetobacter genomosp. 15BJ]
MKLKHLSTAMILATLPATGVFAAALDRSGQSMSAFLQPGNYFEAGLSVLDPTVKGQEAGTSATTRKIGDMGDDYYFPSAALKLQLTDKFSFGLLYDQPYGADAQYSGNNVFVSNPGADTVLPQDRLDALANAGKAKVAAYMQSDAAKQAIGTLMSQGLSQQAATQAVLAEASKPLLAMQKGLADANASLGVGNTAVEVDTQNISLVFGYQPIPNINLYAGGVYQTVKGNVNLRGTAYSIYNGYDANIKETGGTGWLVGAAYQIPEIALKASVTYRSEIDHKVNINENFSVTSALTSNPAVLAGLLGITPAQALAQAQALEEGSAGKKTKITTPQSVNLDFQTGIMANTVAFANVRWVNWKDFAIQPYKFGLLSQQIGGLVGRPNGFNLVEYSDDQWSVNAGVGRKLSEQWAGNVSVGWDSGAGNPVTTLGPTEGYWNVGVGVQFSPTPATFIAGGVKYFWLGDAKAQTGAQAGGNEYVAKFEDNNAIAYGLKIGYRF